MLHTAWRWPYVVVGRRKSVTQAMMRLPIGYQPERPGRRPGNIHRIGNAQRGTLALATAGSGLRSDSVGKESAYYSSDDRARCT